MKEKLQKFREEYEENLAEYLYDSTSLDLELPEWSTLTEQQKQQFRNIHKVLTETMKLGMEVGAQDATNQ